MQMTWLCGKSEEDLRAMVGYSVELCRRRSLKVTAVMVLNGEEGLECKIYINRIPLKQVSEFKYLGCVLDKSGIHGAECNRKVASGKRCRYHQVPS